jgi:osmotically-inducible protein OsmY
MRIVNALLAGVLAVTIGGCAATKSAAQSTGEYASDSWITTKIKSQYGVNKEVKANRINVDTNDGIVTLKGVVDSPNEAQEAIRQALNIKGVRAVRSELRFPTEGTQEARVFYPGEPIRF